MLISWPTQHDYFLMKFPASVRVLQHVEKAMFQSIIFKAWRDNNTEYNRTGTKIQQI